jgi:hypothetical protein
MKKKYIFIITLIILILIVGSIYKYNQLQKHDDLNELKNKVVKHLTSKGYKTDDYSIDISYHWESRLFGQDPYVIGVQFKDETDALYYYKYDTRSSNTEIRQSGVAPLIKEKDKNFKHAE